MKYNADERVLIAMKVCKLYSTGKYTIQSCCIAVGVRYYTYKNWAAPAITDFNSLPSKKKKQLLKRGFVHEVHAIYIAAKMQSEIAFKELLVNKSREGLLRKVSGSYVVEKHAIKRRNSEGNMEVVREKHVNKYIPPDTRAIIFALTNLENGIRNDNNPIPPLRSYLTLMSDTELAAEKNRIQLRIEQANKVTL